jgi:hypothetical protein
MSPPIWQIDAILFQCIYQRLPNFWKLLQESKPWIRNLIYYWRWPVCWNSRYAFVYCWGDNSAQVDGGKEKVLCKPTKVEGLPKVAQLANGSHSSCILSVDNEVYCWGFYWNGTLTGDKIGFTPPKKVPWLAS